MRVNLRFHLVEPASRRFDNRRTGETPVPPKFRIASTTVFTMAEVLILLRRDPKTGKQNIIVKLESDPDSLPIEHEQLHKRIVEKLVGKGMKAEDLGDIVIEREGSLEPKATNEPSEAERKKTAQGQS